MAVPVQKAEKLQQLIQQGQVWQGRERTLAQAAEWCSSGHSELDRWLGGGWVRGSINELQLSAPFIGELDLLLPVLRAAAHAVWLNPPAEPYAWGWQTQGIDPARQLVVNTSASVNADKNALWALQQCIQAGCAEVVLAWFPELSAAAVRQVQQSLAQQSSLVFVFTAISEDTSAKAYTHRLKLTRAYSAAAIGPVDQGLQIEVLKRRGGWPLPAQPYAAQGYWPLRRQRAATAVKPSNLVQGPWQ